MLPFLLMSVVAASSPPLQESKAPREPTEELQEILREGRYAHAEERARALLIEAERQHGPESLEAARILDLLAESMRRGGKGGAPEAVASCERALRIKERTLGRDHPEVAASLVQIGFLRYVNGAQGPARNALERALEIRERSLGPDHPDVAATLLPLAALATDAGDHPKALELFERAFRIRETAFGPSSVEVAECLDAIGAVLYRSGDFVTAVEKHERALAIWEANVAPNHPKIANCLNNLGGVLYETGDYDGSLSCARRAWKLRKETLGPQHELVATSLMNIGTCLAAQGHPMEARRQFEQAIGIREKRFGSTSPEVGRALTRFGLTYLQENDFTHAEPALERAVSNLEQGLSSGHPDLADALAALATVRAANGDRASAEAMYERAIDIREKALGPRHPDVGLVLTQYARVLEGRGETSRAIEVALRAEDISREHLRLTTRSLAERHALAYAAARPSGARIALAAVLAHPRTDASRVRDVWDSLIRGRTLVFDEMVARNRASTGSADRETQLVLERLNASRRRLANLLVAGPRGARPDQYRDLVERTREEVERAEREMSARGTDVREEQERSKIGIREVAASLPSDAALVAYAVCGDSARLTYAALILKHGRDEPRAVSIGSVSRVNALVSRWLGDLQAPPSGSRSARTRESRTRRSGEDLRRAIWDPVAAELGDTRRVFVVPEGQTNLVSFAALPVGADRYLIETGHTFHYLTAERDVAAPAPARAGSTLLILGDPAFDATRLSEAPSKKARGPATRGASDCLDFGSLRFERLPHSIREVQDVSAIWNRAGSSLVLTRGRATESAFKSKAPGRDVLHLATHGFFLGDECAAEPHGARGIGGSISVTSPARAKTAPGHNPLQLSGLALAGANQRASSTLEEDDGILTAEEIASLDLAGVEWAVLSACDTGRGRIQVGEGVMGLRRAFLVAGARTVVMSLWAVEDEDARVWMKALYEERVARGIDTADAVTQASLRMLRERRAQARSTDSVHWAAFVAAGDWR